MRDPCTTSSKNATPRTCLHNLTSLKQDQEMRRLQYVRELAAHLLLAILAGSGRRFFLVLLLLRFVEEDDIALTHRRWQLSILISVEVNCLHHHKVVPALRRLQDWNIVLMFVRDVGGSMLHHSVSQTGMPTVVCLYLPESKDLCCHWL